MKSKSERSPTSFFGVPMSAWKRALVPSPASDLLLEKLAEIGAMMTVKGNKLEGCDPELLRELGSLLMAVANGKPAGRLFRQNEKTKPQRKKELQIAFVYHYMRACGDDLANDSAAVAQVIAAKGLRAPPSHARIRKIAQNHREKVLDTFERKGHAELGGLMISFTATEQQVSSRARFYAGNASDDERRETEQLFDHWRARRSRRRRAHADGTGEHA